MRQNLKETPHFLKKTFVLSQRPIAIVLSICMILMSGPVQASEIPAMHLEMERQQNAESQIEVPEELGTIEEVWIAPSGEQEKRQALSFNPKAQRPQLPDKTIIYIQDAHDSLEAQENIAGMIHYLVENYGIRTVFEEGYEGKVPTDEFFASIKDPEIKEEVSHFLMDQLRLGGAEYAHVNRFYSVLGRGSSGMSKKRIFQAQASRLMTQDPSLDFELIGADSFKLHQKNIEWYQKTAMHQQETAADLKEMQTALRSLANQYFSKTLKEWMKLKGKLDSKEMDLLDYLKRTQQLFLKGVGLEEFQNHYPHIALLLAADKTQSPKLLEKLETEVDYKALFLEINRLEDDYADQQLGRGQDPALMTRDRQIFYDYKLLQLLSRLNRMEVTEEEYEAVTAQLQGLDTLKIAEFIAAQTHKAVVLPKRWERNIRAAISFYETARKRDAAIESSLGSWVLSREGGKNHTTQDSKLKTTAPAVLVFGGFHKENIKQILRQNGFSYYIVSPKITHISPRHQDYYKRLMSVGYHPFEAALGLVATALSPERVLSPGGAAQYDPKFALQPIVALAEQARARGLVFDSRLAAQQLNDPSWSEQLKGRSPRGKRIVGSEAITQSQAEIDSRDLVRSEVRNHKKNSKPNLERRRRERLKKERQRRLLDPVLNPSAPEFDLAQWFNKVWWSEVGKVHDLSVHDGTGADLYQFVERVVGPLAPEFDIRGMIGPDEPLEFYHVEQFESEFLRQVLHPRGFVLSTTHTGFELVPIVSQMLEKSEAGRDIPVMDIQADIIEFVAGASKDYILKAHDAPFDERLGRNVAEKQSRWQSFEAGTLKYKPEAKPEIIVLLRDWSLLHVYGPSTFPEVRRNIDREILAEEKSHSDALDYAARLHGRYMARSDPYDNFIRTIILLQHDDRLRLDRMFEETNKRLDSPQPLSQEEIDSLEGVMEAAAYFELEGNLRAIRSSAHPLNIVIDALESLHKDREGHKLKAKSRRRYELLLEVISEKLLGRATSDVDVWDKYFEQIIDDAYAKGAVESLKQFLKVRETVRQIAANALETRFLSLTDRERWVEAVGNLYPQVVNLLEPFGNEPNQEFVATALMDASIYPREDFKSMIVHHSQGSAVPENVIQELIQMLINAVPRSEIRAQIGGRQKAEGGSKAEVKHQTETDSDDLLRSEVRSALAVPARMSVATKFGESISKLRLEDLKVRSGVILDADELALIGPADFEEEFTELLILVQRNKAFHVYVDHLDRYALTHHQNPWLKALMAEPRVRQLRHRDQLKGKAILMQWSLFDQASPGEKRVLDIQEKLQTEQWILPVQGKAGTVTTFLKAAQSALQRASEIKAYFEAAVLNRIAIQADGRWQVREDFMTAIRSELRAAYAVAVAA